MNKLFVLLVSLFLAFSLVLICAEQPKPPDKLVFRPKMGKVTYDHKKHSAQVKNDCKTCHDKLFVQDAKAPLKFKEAMHKTAEAAKSSCAGCHVTGGAAFVTKGNCNKCHVKEAAKT